MGWTDCRTQAHWCSEAGWHSIKVWVDGGRLWDGAGYTFAASGKKADVRHDIRAGRLWLDVRITAAGEGSSSITASDCSDPKQTATATVNWHVAQPPTPVPPTPTSTPVPAATPTPAPTPAPALYFGAPNNRVYQLEPSYTVGTGASQTLPDPQGGVSPYDLTLVDFEHHYGYRDFDWIGEGPFSFDAGSRTLTFNGNWPPADESLFYEGTASVYLEYTVTDANKSVEVLPVYADIEHTPAPAAVAPPEPVQPQPVAVAPPEPVQPQPVATTVYDELAALIAIIERLDAMIQLLQALLDSQE